MYVRPYHIPLVNQLAREFFWPGIDRKCKAGLDLLGIILKLMAGVPVSVLVPLPGPPYTIHYSN